MSKKLFVSILCALAVLFAFTGCKKDEAPKAEEAPAAEAKADDAKAEAPAAEAKADEAKADEAKPADGKVDVKKAAKDAADFMVGLSKVATDAGEDCAKMGTDMTKYLTDNKDKFTASMKVLSTLKEDSPEAAEVKDELEKVGNTMGDDSDFKKAIDKCSETAEVQQFSLAFLAVMMAAATEEGAADAPAADAPAAE